MKDKIIAKIFENNINIVSADVPNDLKKEFAEAYYKYLVEVYLDDDLKETDIPNIIKFDLLNWSHTDYELKLSQLLGDITYKELSEISYKGLNLAKKRMNDNENNNPTIDTTSANNYIKILEDNLSKVRFFNSERAKIIVSEGIMDFLYASGQTENTSLRIGRNRYKK